MWQRKILRVSQGPPHKSLSDSEKFLQNVYFSVDCRFVDKVPHDVHIRRKDPTGQMLHLGD